MQSTEHHLWQLFSGQDNMKKNIWLVEKLDRCGQLVYLNLTDLNPN